MKLHKAIQLTNAMIHKMNAAPSAITKTFSMNIENKTRSMVVQQNTNIILHNVHDTLG